jgi:hypothetical protein
MTSKVCWNSGDIEDFLMVSKFAEYSAKAFIEYDPSKVF